jgi:flagellar basal-body rod protein FlgF
MEWSVYEEEKSIMNEILSLALSSMQQDMRRLDSIGVNLANTMTPGYKREVVAAPAFSTVFDVIANHARTSSIHPSTIDAGANQATLQLDQRNGTLKSTGQSLDVAFASEGYFEVTTEQGPAYTRQGNFRVDARGRLVTAQGYPAMGKNGDIYLNNPTPVIDAAGNVFESIPVGGRPNSEPNSPPIAQLKVMQFDNPKSVQRLGEGLVTGEGAPSQMNEADIQIRQGFLENSNVSSMHEMVQLMQTMRHFESMQKVSLGYDDMIGSAIRKLGDMS